MLKEDYELSREDYDEAISAGSDHAMVMSDLTYTS